MTMYRLACLCAACLLLMSAGYSAARAHGPATIIEDIEQAATPQAPTEDPLCVYYEYFQ